MASLDDIVKQNEDLINKVNDIIVSTEFRSIKNIYIDLPLLRDTRMGLLLNLAKTKEERDYLLNNLDKYNIRPNRHFTTVYPEFKYSEDDLNKFYQNPNNSDAIFNLSPDTSFTYNFESFFEIICSKNARAGMHREMPVITINTYPLKVSTSLEAYMKILQQSFGNIVKFKYITINVKEITRELWNSFDMLLIDDLAAVLDRNGIFKDLLFKEMKFITKTIFAPYSCDDDILAKWKQYKIDITDPVTANDIFKVSEYLIATYCHFKFMLFQIPLPKE